MPAGGDAQSYVSNSYPYTDSALMRSAERFLKVSRRPQSFDIRDVSFYFDGALLPLITKPYAGIPICTQTSSPAANFSLTVNE